ncbi:MAG: hypothetical protein EKK47_10720 [Burkholderiales bacterium]|jgi:hypothetical protein|nr:MAG: hypothetical protein EKK47_10720 [Burkholderiales bacterium]
MDQQRRKLLIGVSTLPLGLSACGGGGDAATNTATSHEGMATAASVRPSSGPYIEISAQGLSLNSSDWQYNIFPSPNPFRYMVPPVNRIHAVSANGGARYVEINDVIVVNGVTYSRSLWMRLSAPTTINGTTFSLTNAGNAGLLTSVMLGNPASYKQYTLSNGSVGLVQVGTSDQYSLTLTDLYGAPATNQVLSGSVVASVDNQASSTNLQVQTPNGGVVITLAQQDVAWI